MNSEHKLVQVLAPLESVKEGTPNELWFKDGIVQAPVGSQLAVQYTQPSPDRYSLVSGTRPITGTWWKAEDVAAWDVLDRTAALALRTEKQAKKEAESKGFDQQLERLRWRYASLPANQRGPFLALVIQIITQGR